MLAEVGLPSVYPHATGQLCVHPALLDACFQSVAAHPECQTAGNGGLLLPLGVRRLRAYASTRNGPLLLRPGYHGRAAEVEADLDVLDEHGTVLLTVRGLQMGTGASESSDRDRCWASGCWPSSGNSANCPSRHAAERRNMAADQHFRYL